MKYVKMVLLPVAMIAVAMLVLWGMVSTSGFVQMLLTALMIVSIVGLIAWDFAGLKTTADRLIAAGLIVVLGGALKIVSFFFADWPWVAMGQPSQTFGFVDVVTRLWTPLLNWWVFGGLALGSAIAALGMIWIVKNNKM
jgi:hypothetical protein